MKINNKKEKRYELFDLFDENFSDKVNGEPYALTTLNEEISFMDIEDYMGDIDKIQKLEK